jgi:glutathione-dependent peroxiredoxin
MFDHIPAEREGKRVPEVTFHARRDGDWHRFNSADVFAGKKVIVFGLPGAFTPTCSSAHLPRYNELVPTFRSLGIEDVAVVAVNDAFVMDAWQVDQKADNVIFLPDGNGEFADGMGLLADKEAIGFGKRTWRYSMLVNDGVIEKLFVEPDKPGDPFEVSDADTMLRYLGGEEKLPPEVTIFAKPGCPFCLKAKALLKEKGYSYEEIVLDHGVSYKTLRNVTGKRTAPQIYVDGEHIEGFDALKAWFAAKDK